MQKRPVITAFILGFLISVLLGLAFFAGQQQSSRYVGTLEQRQVLLTSKIQLIEMKVDVINGQKSSAELQSDFDSVMGVLEQSHQYTGEGIIARDQAMQAAAAEINASLMAGGERLVRAIESMLEVVEGYLYNQNSEAASSDLSEMTSVQATGT